MEASCSETWTGHLRSCDRRHLNGGPSRSGISPRQWRLRGQGVIRVASGDGQQLAVQRQLDSGKAMTALGRVAPVGSTRTGRSRPEVAQWEPCGLLFRPLRTIMASTAAGMDVGLVALTERSPGDGDRLLTLHKSLSISADQLGLCGCAFGCPSVGSCRRWRGHFCLSQSQRRHSAPR